MAKGSGNRTASGLGALFSNFSNAFNESRKTNAAIRESSWKDPNRPLGLRDFLEPAVKEYVSQSTLAPYLGKTMPPFGDFMQNFMSSLPQIASTQIPIQPKMPTTPFPTATGPIGQNQIAMSSQVPSTPAPVSRSGYSAQDLANALKKRGIIQ